MPEYNHSHKIGAAIARFRAESNLTQAELASRVCLDQSRVSRIEKGEIIVPADIDRLLDALAEHGAPEARDFKNFVNREWRHIQPPSFWNPERACLEIADELLEKVHRFLNDENHPWPLRRQVEKHRESLLRAAGFLGKLEHNVAFIGDIGVGKSTAISFIFDLLVPPSVTDKAINRPVLETGAGGTTVCEVHVKSGPEFGISVIPETEAEIRAIVGEFCAAKWTASLGGTRGGDDNVGVSREVERAIRNMAGLARKRVVVEGKPAYDDPAMNLAKTCGSEEEFRTRVLGLLKIDARTRNEIWYDSSTRKNPMEWIAETFRAVNNGRMADVPLPKTINLLIPDFGQAFGELEITVIDTKGVVDVAVREDLDLRLRDSRTTAVLCSRFNDAPGTSSRVLLQHMRQTFSERFDTGKVSVLALPRSEEARAMKDDEGEQALTDAEGYEFKRMQIASEFAAEDLAGIPVNFYNFEADDALAARNEIFAQLTTMRKAAETHLFDLCKAAEDIIENHEAQALNAAIEEVASRLSMFLKGNRTLGASERLAHAEAIHTIKGIRYASTLWASTRRNGESANLNIPHLIGVGAARDANLRCERWFDGMNAFLKSLTADEALLLASRTIEQISASATSSRRAFLDAAQRGGIEVYREPLSHASVWQKCASEWGRGSGFKTRVADHLEEWFTKNADLKERLDQMINCLWDQIVITPLLRLAEESAPEATITGQISI